MSLLDGFLLVSLINREVRLYKLKKTIYSFSEELIFEKSFDYVASYTRLYKSAIQQFYNIFIAQDREQKNKIIVYQFLEV